MVDFNGVFGRQRRIVENAESVGFVAFRMVSGRTDNSDSASAFSAQDTLDNLHGRSGRQQGRLVRLRTQENRSELAFEFVERRLFLIGRVGHFVDVIRLVEPQQLFRRCLPGVQPVTTIQNAVIQQFLVDGCDPGRSFRMSPFLKKIFQNFVKFPFF